MKNFFAIIFCVLFSMTMHGQDGGMRIFAGTTIMVNNDEIANPPGRSHSGYHIGVDGRLMSGGMAFLVGAKYTSVSSTAVEGFKLSGHESTLSIMNGRGGLDISIFAFTDLIRIRTKILASFDIVLNQNGPDISPQGYILNDGWLGFVTGFGVDVGPAIFDVEYELGVINGYNKKKESTFNSFTISLGFFF